MAIDLMMMASAGLVNLALSGSPNMLQAELQAQGVNSTIITRDDFSSAAGGRSPTSDLFIARPCFNNRVEFLAPRGLQLPDGSKWAMFEPCHYPDHFIIEYADGRLERWDVGNRGTGEGDNMPFRVEIVEGAAQPLADAAFPAPFPHDSIGGSSGGGGGGGSGAGLAIGGIAAVGIAVYIFSGGSAADVSFAPEYALHYAKDGGARHFYGARWEYQKDNWRASWAASRASAAEDWRYASGVEWTAGAWTAAVNGESFGSETEADLSIAAVRETGGWILHSGATARARFDEFGAEFSHSLTAAANRRIAEWQIYVSVAARDLDAAPSAKAGALFTRNF